MFISKILKYSFLYLISVLIMTVFLYLTGILCLFFEIFNEYIFGCFLGVLHSIIILLSGNKLINKIKISFKHYLLCTTFIPALFFDVSSVIFLSSKIEISVLDSAISEILYYFVFMGIAFSITSIVVATIELFKFLKNCN